MKQLFLDFLNNFWVLFNSIALFIIIGVLVAGVFKLVLPDSFIKKHLGSRHFFSNIKAAILGIPLPLCSCSVIPFISALKKGGASSSAIQTFVIATPITGADSIFATYGVFGWIFTLFRIVTSIIIALVAGLLTLLFIKENDSTPAENTLEQPKLSNIGIPLNIPVVKAEPPATNQVYDAFQKILSYAFDDIYKDIAKSLVIGVIIGALIVTFIPDNIAEYISGNPLLNYLLVLFISMPLYVCATASIPLGLSLLSAGFSPGAAFIFLTAGPATNTVTMSVVLKTLGKGSLVIYLASVIIGSVLFGFAFDHFFANNLEQIQQMGVDEENAGFISKISSVILLYISVMYIFNKNAQLIKRGSCCDTGCCS
ncbi:MAG: SO_0444 family Cu/Zn efflux transporter [Methylococcales bacterium]|jgi:uncharacterized protein|nr:SO_0444 family Cu/Zn efflux transporter [Methylococcales bacterium]MBT7444562.1 SO_0444 family Cu/Zn efflux transporter [Methylococcales bacterium]